MTDRRPVVVKFRRHKPEAKLPIKVKGYAGYGLTPTQTHTLRSADHWIYHIPTGLCVEIPQGYYGKVERFERAESRKHLPAQEEFLTVHPDIIDPCDKERPLVMRVELNDNFQGLTYPITQDTILARLTILPDVETFLSQTYGSSLLPTTIPVDEFEAIVKEVEKVFRRQRKLTQTRLAALKEAQQAKRENTGEKPSETPTEQPGETGHEQGQNEQRELKREASAVSVSSVEQKAQKQEGSADGTLLTQWYKLDENTMPPVYRLQKISTYMKDILRNDPNVRNAAKKTWQGTAEKLIEIMQTQSKVLLEDPRDRQKYFQSAVDREIETGLLYADCPDEMCLWYDRSIVDIYSHLGETKAREYIDTWQDIPEVDPARAELLEDLRARMSNRLSKKNARFYEVNWSSEGIDERVRAHDKYFEKVAQDFRNTMLKRLEDLFKEDTKRHTWKMQLYEEVSRHVDFCHERARQFHGRKELLNMIKRYVRSKYRHPLVIYGKSGCGKSSLMAKAAKDTYKWFKGRNPITAVRMVGVTSDSTNIRLLLKGICQQLCLVFGNDQEELPEDYRGIMNDFGSRVTQATEDQPIIIFIDSLNQLSDENDARGMGWLPKELPEHVHLIISTLPDERYDAFTCLKSAFPKGQNFVEVPQMHEGDAVVLLEHWLKESNRSLTHEQFDLIMEAFKKCPLPLYLKIAFDESLLWTSYMPLDRLKLSDTVKKAVGVLYARLEGIHGEPLVRRALGYLTAAKNGITENEMQDLLSLDDAVMDDMMIQIKLPFRRCPPVSWLRLRMDLRDYVVERSADNCKPLRWFQSQFYEAAEERYLNAKDKAPSYHKAIAEYFMGIYKDGKPLAASGENSERYISAQNLYEEIEDSSGNLKRVYNHRKLSELPYNLIKGQMFDDMKSLTLCNFEFLLAKLCAGTLRGIIEDFQMALTVEPDDGDLKLLAHTLHLSSKALQRDKCQLASQLVGRLQEIISKDKPVAPSDPRKFPSLHPLFRQATKSSIPSLIPSMACLTQPDGILFDLLSGHREPITAVTNTTDGLRALTTSKDDTLKLWDLRQGKVTKTIRGVGASCQMIKTAINNSLIITSEASQIRIWSMRTGECVKVIDEYVDPAVITIAKDGTILAAYYDGSLVLRSWALKPQITKLVEVKLHEEEDEESTLLALHKDRAIIVAKTGHGEKTLSAFRSASNAMVHNCKTGELIFNLKSSEPGASITAVAISREYFIVACRYQYMKHHEIFYLELFDVQTGGFIRKIRGCTMDDVKDLLINQIGSHAICVCSSEQNNTSNVAIWNLETEDHKHLAFHATVSSMGACMDLRYLLTGSKSENVLRIWNLSTSVNQSAPKVKVKEGVKSMHVMNDNSKYVVAESFEKGVVQVWNITRNNFTGEIVRKERGLIEKQDVILFRNQRAVILADLAISSVSEDNQQVFQTLFVYNLDKQKYERKIKDCFIVPSPAHEFKVLSDDRLMGLSENRSHFIVWNMKNGHVQYRIRPNFRELERRRLEWGVTSKQEQESKPPKLGRSTTAMMTPWDRRTETESARKQRKQKEVEEEKKRQEDMKKEKDNSVEQYIMSADEKIIVASFFAHHLCVFNVDTHEHLQTLEDENSMLYLYVAALTSNGSHIVVTNYDEEAKVSYVTLWDCRTGEIRKRLKNEKDVCAIAINDNADRIIFGKEKTEMRIWDPTRSNSLRRVKGYKGMKFGVQSKIALLNNGELAAVFAGDISIWDLDKGEMLSVFTPDMNIQCFEIALRGQLIVFGLRDTSKVVTLRLSKNHRQPIEVAESDIFGEKAESSDEDSEDEDKLPETGEEEE